jgi:hypothetical protein
MFWPPHAKSWMPNKPDTKLLQRVVYRMSERQGPFDHGQFFFFFFLTMLSSGRKHCGYQMKLLNPRTKIQTPVNWTTELRSLLNASISCGNIGARASGPIPCMKLTAVARNMELNFHCRFQFCILLFRRILVAMVIQKVGNFLQEGRVDHLTAEVQGHGPN